MAFECVQIGASLHMTEGRRRQAIGWSQIPGKETRAMAVALELEPRGRLEHAVGAKHVPQECLVLLKRSR